MVKKALKNCYFDTAAAPFLYDSSIYGQLHAVIGARLIFGSDFPLITQERIQLNFPFLQFGRIQIGVEPLRDSFASFQLVDSISVILQAEGVQEHSDDHLQGCPSFIVDLV